MVVADVDGTLVTPEKTLTPRARSAVRRVIESGIAFTITSSRPPRGMKMLIDELQLQGPIAGFNGGVFVKPDLSIIKENVLPPQAVQPVIDIIAKYKFDIWIYRNNDWFIHRPNGSHVQHEQRTVQFAPIIVPSFQGLLDSVAKIVGVSDDLAGIEQCQREVQQACGVQVSAVRSQPYYLDVTHPLANKGEAVSVLAGMFHVPTENIVTIGDMPNDVLMFKRSGMSIAMGNAVPDVHQAATFVTSPNTEDGFAVAMEKFVLRAPTA